MPVLDRPNLLIAGSQKSGTTWLHQSLDKSSAIFGSKVKELDYFNKPKCHRPALLAEYLEHFPEQPGVRYYMESTPHYFRIPRGDVDTAANVRDLLVDPKIIVILRQPVKRYASAYVHHMMRGRREYTPTITEITDDFGMVTLGRYAQNLEHWLGYFPDIKVVFHDDLVSDPTGLIDDVMAYLGLANDIPPKALEFRVNDKSVKMRKKGFDWDVLPTLADDTAAELQELYRPDIERLAEMTGRDLSSWLR